MSDLEYTAIKGRGLPLMCLQRVRRLDTIYCRIEEEGKRQTGRKREAQLMKARKGMVEVSRHPLYFRAGAVKTS